MILCPCKDCKNRIVTENGKVCEKTCDAWINYSNEKQIEKEKMNSKKQIFYEINRQHINRIKNGNY